MLAQVKILAEGYTNADSSADIKEEKTRPTISLVKDEGVVMIVDPGTLESQQVLIDALAQEDLSVEDVNYVCITHSHIDHYRNIGMFPSAKTLECYGVWDKEVVVPWLENFSKNIKVLTTPGHDSTSISLFVTTDEGVVAICGDVFWREDYPEDPYDDTYADNYDKLKESRDKVLQMADWIVPGHGQMYKVHKMIEAPSREIARAGAIKANGKCRKCGKAMSKAEACLCRPWRCFNCCECDMDCDLCGCGHKKIKSKI